MLLARKHTHTHKIPEWDLIFCRFSFPSFAFVALKREKSRALRVKSSEKKQNFGLLLLFAQEGRKRERDLEHPRGETSDFEECVAVVRR
jgi:hypothetical protein